PHPDPHSCPTRRSSDPVLAGKGNNGADGRSAARRLRRRGVRVQVIEAHAAPYQLPPADLVIDAAYGTGFRGAYRAPLAVGGGQLDRKSTRLNSSHVKIS